MIVFKFFEFSFNIFHQLSVSKYAFEFIYLISFKVKLYACNLLQNIFSLNRNFQSFDTSQSVDPSTAYSGSFYDPNAYAAPDPVYDAASTDFDNEPPLLEGKTIQ